MILALILIFDFFKYDMRTLTFDDTKLIIYHDHYYENHYLSLRGLLNILGVGVEASHCQ